MLGYPSISLGAIRGYLIVARATDDFTVGDRIIGRVAFMVSFPTIITRSISLVVKREHLEMFSSMSVCYALTLAIAARYSPRHPNCLVSEWKSIRHNFHPLSKLKGTGYTTFSELIPLESPLHPPNPGYIQFSIVNLNLLPDWGIVNRHYGFIIYVKNTWAEYIRKRSPFRGSPNCTDRCLSNFKSPS